MIFISHVVLLFSVFLFVALMIFMIRYKEILFCYYCSWALFLRSIFMVERRFFLPTFASIIPLITILTDIDTQLALMLQCRILVCVGVYLMATDLFCEKISYYLNTLNDNHYLKKFFNDRYLNTLKGRYLSAGWSSLFMGKTHLLTVGRATTGVGLMTAGTLLYNGYWQREHETCENEKTRTHENESAARARAFENYKYARDHHGRFSKGPKPTWDDNNYEKWKNAS